MTIVMPIVAPVRIKLSLGVIDRSTFPDCDNHDHLSDVLSPCSLPRQGVRMKDKKHIPTDGGPTKWTNPFAVLKHVPVPTPSPSQAVRDQSASAPNVPKKNRGRVDIIRQTAHRGGKTVTVVTGFVGISQSEKEALAKQMQKVCGAGGTVKEGRIEIQGDQRDTVARILTEAGFRPVFAGG